MKKVLITITSINGGGAERVVSVWANKLYSTGYDVSILVLARQDNEYNIQNNIKIYSVAENTENYLKTPFLKRLRKIRSFLKEIKPDVLINFLPTMQIWMLLASFGLKLKNIETVRNNPDREISGIKRKIWKLCLFLSSKVILQTKTQGEFFGNIIKNKSVVIPNSLDQKYIDFLKLDYSEINTKFIAVGRLAPQKNYPLMIKAFKLAIEKYPNIKLSIFGSKDPYELQKLINDNLLQDNIFLMGRSENINNELIKSDAFLMSSDYEGMPNALAEAMATGLVCISTDCKTGPNDLIDNEINGFLVPVGDVDEFANAIINVANMSKQMSEKIGKAAREKILNFCSEENSFIRLVNLIEEMI